MASDKYYLEYVLETLRKVENVTFKKMMGEYLLFSDGVLFGGVYDNRFLVKKTPSLSVFSLEEEIPYDGGKPMYLIDTEEPEEVAAVISAALSDLKTKK